MSTGIRCGADPVPRTRPRRGASGTRVRLARAAGLALLLGCASGPPPAARPPAWSEALDARAAVLEAHLATLPPAGGDALVVRLAFGAEADLDLYVTEPGQETVYFANTPLRAGGALEEDVRCPDAPLPADGVRVETVRFDAPRPGRYRVGVDHPSDCGSGIEVAPFALSIEHHGTRQTLRGLAALLVFDPIVAERTLP